MYHLLLLFGCIPTVRDSTSIVEPLADEDRDGFAEPDRRGG